MERASIRSLYLAPQAHPARSPVVKTRFRLDVVIVLTHTQRRRRIDYAPFWGELNMSLSLVQSRALLGLHASAVTVEVHLANGLPSFTLVGLADVEVKEARERVRSAIQNSGLEFP